jgi:hypothetical protein
MCRLYRRLLRPSQSWFSSAQPSWCSTATLPPAKELTRSALCSGCFKRIVCKRSTLPSAAQPMMMDCRGRASPRPSGQGHNCLPCRRRQNCPTNQSANSASSSLAQAHLSVEDRPGSRHDSLATLADAADCLRPPARPARDIREAVCTCSNRSNDRACRRGDRCTGVAGRASILNMTLINAGRRRLMIVSGPAGSTLASPLN